MNLSKATFSGVLRVPEASGSFHQGEDWKMGQFGICLHPYTLLSIYEFILSSVRENRVNQYFFYCQLISCLVQRKPFTLTLCSFRFLNPSLIALISECSTYNLLLPWSSTGGIIPSCFIPCSQASIWYLEVKVQNLYVIVGFLGCFFLSYFVFLVLACFSNTGL